MSDHRGLVLGGRRLTVARPAKVFLEVDSGAANGSEPLATVPAKYRRLLVKYTELVEKFGSVTSERFALAKLSSWITQSRLSGLVLIQNDRIVLRNARFSQLAKDSAGGGKWSPCGAGKQALKGVSFTSLSDVVVALAERMLVGELPSMLNVRYERERRSQVVHLRLERGQPTSSDAGIVLALLDDVTLAARAEAELGRARQALQRRETLRAVGEMASGVAHDLANLLSAIQMRIAAMQRELGTSVAQREQFDGLARILSDGTGMLARLQDFARAGRKRLVEPVDLAAVIRESVEMVCSSLTEKAALAGTQISIILQLSALPPVMGVAVDLRQMFVNLLLNARDAMARGGNIEISARASPGGGVMVKVEDQGSGVPAEIRDRIFDAFYTTKGERGTGLGLWMASDLMKRLGGRISVANRRQGGAVFTLRFLEAAPDAAGRRAAAATPALSSRSAPARPRGGSAVPSSVRPASD